jgi:hypothetical protein
MVLAKYILRCHSETLRDKVMLASANGSFTQADKI